jgi:mono/diheme cytochrome c family protein
VRIHVFLDDEQQTRAILNPPATFELDTTQLSDGHHRLRVQAIDDNGTVGVEEIPFIVRNGPGIDVVGLPTGQAVQGRVPILVNAFSSRLGDVFEPVRAETPAPIPTWTWVLALVVVAWAMWYSAMEFQEYPQRTVAAVPPTAQSTSPAAGSTVSQTTWAILGEQVFGNKCAACHQVSGMGVAGVFPPLAGDAVVTATDSAEHLRIVLRGRQGKAIRGVAYPSPMPAFADQLTDDEIAAVINHERTSWGNKGPLVTPKDVAALR